ncbi:unnamed protein product [marine sediment metagenome]|uniref:Aspartyl/glutamyl-tRNA(Asn/Gln) amidotransferase subunit C n=1 Tax=marine sediment metagenome TaxID=412755 RepID=X1KZM0_9ZZZZ
MINKEKIKKEAKQILDKFASALKKVEKEHDIEIGVERDEFERKESDEKKYKDKDFKKKFLENAPEHDDDFIITEKGNWK